MERKVTSLADLQKMREEMERAWESLMKRSTTVEEREVWKWVEKLPKFEGTGKRNLNPRSNKTIKFWQQD